MCVGRSEKVWKGFLGVLVLTEWWDDDDSHIELKNGYVMLLVFSQKNNTVEYAL